MQFFRVPNPDIFVGEPEAAMDLHFARGRYSGQSTVFVVVGGRVAFPWQWEPDREPGPKILDYPWLDPSTSNAERDEAFQSWWHDLQDSPGLEPSPPDELPPWEVVIRPERNRESDRPQQEAYRAFLVGPLGPLPPPPKRPSSVYGHLPFGTQTKNDTIIYRWEAFPTSLRVIRKAGGRGGIVKAGTYAAPASELAMVPSGFSATARYALPTLFPACWRWELQPVPCFIECGASVPLYGQSGGGVEVKFPADTDNRCPIADPVVLSPL